MNKPASELIALADKYAAKAKLKWPHESFVEEMLTIEIALRTAANQSGSERAGVDALREALDCLQSIADMEDDEPRQPDDADWRFRALECKRAAQCTIAALAREEIGAAEEIQSSDGGVEGHAAVPLEIPTQRSGESRDPLGDGSVKVGPHREDAAGIKPGPSEAPSTHTDGAVRESQEPEAGQLSVREFREDAFRSMEVQICGDTRTVQFGVEDHGGDHPTMPCCALSWTDAADLASWVQSCITHPTTKPEATAVSVDATKQARELIDLYFAPWGAAKAVRWEDLTGDKPFDCETALRCVAALIAGER